MSTSVLNASKLIEKLQRNPPSEEALAVLADEIAKGEGGRLFRSLFVAMPQQSADDWAMYDELLRLLDRLIVARPGVAGFLMGHLYSAASRKKLHHVCDGIQLRIYESDSAEMADALMRLADEGVCKKRYLEWAHQVRLRRKLGDGPA